MAFIDPPAGHRYRLSLLGRFWLAACCASCRPRPALGRRAAHRHPARPASTEISRARGQRAAAARPYGLTVREDLPRQSPALVVLLRPVLGLLTGLVLLTRPPGVLGAIVAVAVRLRALQACAAALRLAGPSARGGARRRPVVVAPAARRARARRRRRADRVADLRRPRLDARDPRRHQQAGHAHARHPHRAPAVGEDPLHRLLELHLRADRRLLPLRDDRPRHPEPAGQGAVQPRVRAARLRGVAAHPADALGALHRAGRPSPDAGIDTGPAVAATASRPTTRPPGHARRRAADGATTAAPGQRRRRRHRRRRRDPPTTTTSYGRDRATAACESSYCRASAGSDVPAPSPSASVPTVPAATPASVPPAVPPSSTAADLRRAAEWHRHRRGLGAPAGPAAVHWPRSGPPARRRGSPRCAAPATCRTPSGSPRSRSGTRWCRRSRRPGCRAAPRSGG